MNAMIFYSHSKIYPDVTIEEQKYLAERYCSSADLNVVNFTGSCNDEVNQKCLNIALLGDSRKEYTIVLYSFSCLSSDINEFKLQIQSIIKNNVIVYSIKENMNLDERNYKIAFSLISHLGNKELAEATC